MLNSSTIIRRLVTINPLFQPTRSLLALLHAVDFVESQLSENNLRLSNGVIAKMAEVKNITPAQIIEKPTLTMESIRNYACCHPRRIAKYGSLARRANSRHR